MPNISLDLELNTKTAKQHADEFEGYLDDQRKRLKSEKAYELIVNKVKLQQELETTKALIKQALKEGNADAVLELKIKEETLKKSLNISNQAINNFTKTGNENLSVLSKMFNSVGLAGGKLSGIISSFSPAGGAMASTIGSMATSAGGAVGSFGSLGAAIAGLANPMVLAGAAVVALTAGLSVASGIARQWEDAWIGVTKTVGDSATTEQLEDLRTELVEMTKEIPVTFAELSKLASVGGSLGVPIENMSKFVKTAAELQVAVDGISGEEAATQLAQIGTITGDGTGKIDKMGSTVVALGNKMATTEGQILEFGKRISGATSTAKIGTADMFAFAATMGSLGINAELGGSNFSKALTTIGIAVDTGSDEIKTLAKVSGESSEAFAKHWKEDASGAFQNFLIGLNQAENKAQIIQDVFGTSSEMNRLFTALASDGSISLLSDALATAREEMNLTAGATTALEQEAKKRFESTSAQAQIMKNKWAAALAPIGAIVNDYLVKPFLKGVGYVGDGFGYLIAGITILAKGIGVGVGIIVDFFVRGFKFLGGLFQNFGVVVGEFLGGLVRGIAAGISAIPQVFGAMWKIVSNVFKNFATNFLPAIGTLVDNIGIAFKNIGPLVGAALNALGGLIEDFFNGAVDAVNSFTDNLKAIPFFGEKLAGLTRINKIEFGDIVDFGQVQALKDIPDLLNFDSFGQDIANLGNVSSAALGKMKSEFVKATPTIQALGKEAFAGFGDEVDAKLGKLGAESKRLLGLAQSSGDRAEAKTKAEIAKELVAKQLENVELPSDDKKKGGKSAKQKAKEEVDAKIEELRKKARLEIEAVKESEKTEKEKAEAIREIKDKLDRDIKELQDKSLEQEFADNEEKLKSIKKTEEEKRDEFNDTFEAVQDAQNDSIKKIGEYAEKIEDLKGKFQELRDKAVENIRDINNQLGEIDQQKNENTASTYEKLAERRVKLLEEEAKTQKALVNEADLEKRVELQNELAKIQQELSLIQEKIPQQILDEVAAKQALTETERTLLDLKEKNAKLDEKAESLRQKKAVAEAISSGRALKVEGEGADLKAFYQDDKENFIEITDFKAKEYAIDTQAKIAEWTLQLDEQQKMLDQELLNLQNIDAQKRALEQNFTTFFAEEIKKRNAQLQSYIDMAKAAADAMSRVGMTAQASTVTASAASSTNSTTTSKTVTQNFNVTNTATATSLGRTLSSKT